MELQRKANAAKKSGEAKPEPVKKNKKYTYYKYKDKYGEDVFWVMRIDYTNEAGEHDKGFRQCKPNPRSGEKSDWSVQADTKVLYNLDIIAPAIKYGNSPIIYLVEGEKDADTLMRLGRIATTASGGANGPSKQKPSEGPAAYAQRVQEWTKESPMRRVGKKWLPQYTDELAGADVIIVPDDDVVGRAYMEAVGELLAPVAKRVRIVHLRDGYPELKEKGDISDLCAAVGDEKALAILDGLTEKAQEVKADVKLITTAPAKGPEKKEDGQSDHDEVPWREWDMTIPEDRRDRLRWLLINKTPKYTVKDGCLCRYTRDEPTKLCTFVAAAMDVITTHNGYSADQTTYKVEGWTAQGRHLPMVEVSAGEFDKMDWVSTAWPMMVTYASGSNVKSNMREAFTSASMAMHERRDRYTYTGWMDDPDAGWVYLTGNGAIGKDGVDVQLDDPRTRSPLLKYGLEGVDDVSLEEAIESPMLLQSVFGERVGIPLVSMIFLTPLKEFLEKAGVRPSFLMWLHGGYHSGKSVLARLALSFFGDFGMDSAFPSTFQDSAANIRNRASVLKDSLLVIDDYKPGEQQMMRNQNSIVDYLARSFADGATRNIMGPDGKERPGPPPRAMGMATGEEVPAVASSALSRFYIVRLRPGDVFGGDKEAEEGRMKVLTELQEMADKGFNRRLMRAYIEWLIPQIPELSKDLHPRFTRYRQQAMERMQGGSKTRLAAMIAHLMIGWEMMTRFLWHVQGLELTADGAEGLGATRERAWNALISNSMEADKDRKELEPQEIFVRNVGAMLESGFAQVRTIKVDDGAPHKDYNPKDLIGYRDEYYYYLIPDAAYTKVFEFCTRGGGNIGLGKQALKRKLLETGIMEKYGRKNKGEMQNTQYWWFARKTIDGEPEPQQTTMAAAYEQPEDDDF